MPIDPARPYLVRASDRTTANEEVQTHPLNPNSEVRGWSLCELVGLKRAGVYLVRVSPGKESFVYHAHQVLEEWMYVLSGRGVTEVDGGELEIGPGDFLGFPTPSLAHHLRNPFAEELVYLTGGEQGPVEVADFPRLGKRLVRSPAGVSIFPLSAELGWDGLPKK